MKVIQIIDRLNVGGAERVFVNLSNLLNNNDSLEISVLTFGNIGELLKELSKEVNKIDFIRPNKFDLRKAYKLSRILKQHDVLHVHMRHVYRYIKVVCKIFNVKSKLVFQDHYGEISKDKSVPKLFKTLLKPTYYIGVSKELTTWARNKIKIKHVFLLSNIINKQSISDVTSNKKGFVIVGNIKPTKNQLFAIKLAISLKKELTIIGRVHDEDYYTMLLQYIEDENCKKQISFLHNVNNIQELLQQFELGLMTSISESGPLVLIEYLAQNLPFIAYKTGEVSDVLCKEFPASFQEDFNLNEWKTSISKIDLDKEKSSAVYNQYFSPETYIQECINIYQEIINY